MLARLVAAAFALLMLTTLFVTVFLLTVFLIVFLRDHVRLL